MVVDFTLHKVLHAVPSLKFYPSRKEVEGVVGGIQGFG